MKVTSSNTVEIKGAELVEALEMYGKSKGLDLTGIENMFGSAKSSDPNTWTLSLILRTKSEEVGGSNAAHG